MIKVSHTASDFGVFILTVIFHSLSMMSSEIICPDPRINFYLYTNENRNSPQKVDPNIDAILKSNFKEDDPNKVIIHGFNSNINLEQLLELKEAYLTNGDYNVWMVDWEILAAGPWYPVVRGRLNDVGACIAQFIKEVGCVTIAEPQKSLHVIGFSLGAHLAAYTANHFRPYKLPRITGLDPALPLFSCSNLDEKLDKTDANFVDVLHTDALKQGKAERCGHIDFFMNGGWKQPGCWNKRKISEYSKCNHHRAISYYAESITSKVGFWGWPCKSFYHYLINKCPPEIPTVQMGEFCNQDETGSYVIRTAAKPQFAIGKNYKYTCPDSQENDSTEGLQMELVSDHISRSDAEKDKLS